jgi:hypothetical protein
MDAWGRGLRSFAVQPFIVFCTQSQSFFACCRANAIDHNPSVTSRKANATNPNPFVMPRSLNAIDHNPSATQHILSAIVKLIVSMGTLNM